MIFGHVGIAALVGSTQRDRIGSRLFVALLVASFAPDIVDIAYFIAGICSPFGLFSHSIPAALLEAAVIGGVALLVTDSWRITLILIAVVLLHVPADMVTGHKILIPGGDIVGLRLYEKPLYDLTAEVLVIAAGWWAIRRAGVDIRWATGRRALIGVVIAQVVCDIIIASSGLGLKPNTCPIAPNGSHGGWLFVP